MTIPDDIMRAAAGIVDAMPHRIPTMYEFTTVIALAIAAERERCAKVADSRIVEGGTEYLAGWRRAAEIIGNDIRKGEQS